MNKDNMKTEQIILQKLEKIEKEVEEIKEHMVDDSILTAEEKTLLNESIKNEKEGKLISSKELRKQIVI